ncbi:MAG: DNA primase [Anaerolineaceae bacterium]|nr:DNA primase [Anaerolineaceae bacterium]MDD4043152.1 DNA primase [Anaerolineaceae bacterium]MDD4577622.1 DNA primase [Anaerolineaceae bacterium]
MTAVEDIKQRIDLVDIVSQTVKLKRTGKNYIGFCPFHSNTRTPAFVVFPESQTWRCFGQCNEGGDLFGFVMKRDNLDFQEALKQLADKAGVTLKPQTQADRKQDQERDILLDIMEASVAFYRQQMLETTPGKKALDYLHHRGLTDETIKTWGLGYAPDGWSHLLDHLLAKGYTREQILQAGMLSKGDDGRVYDRFRDRLMFPIRSMYGKMAGFGGRVLNPEDVPKYLNSPATEVFDKGRLLYGLDQARSNMRAESQAVIVEGYMDVISLHQAGFPNAVSPMGTALTEAHFQLIKKMTSNIVLALDPDAAGQNATLRGLETARKAMGKDEQLDFDSRGLLKIERYLKADIRVTTLPEGKDPDEVVLENPEAWRKIIAEAKPVVIHVMDSLAEGQDLADPKVKRTIAEQVLPLIEDVGSTVEREAYRQRLAALLRLDIRTLQATTPTVSHDRRKRNRTPDQPEDTQIRQPITLAAKNRPLEEFTLKYLVLDPDSLYQIDRFLAQFELTPLDSEDFQEGDMKHLLSLVRQSLAQTEYEPADFVEMNLGDDFELPQILSTEAQSLSDTQSKLYKDRLRCILRLRKNHVEDRLREINFLQNEADEKTYSSEEANLLYLDLIETRRKIDQALISPESGGSGKVRNIPGVYYAGRRYDGSSQK